MELSSADIRILKELQIDSSQTNISLAEKVGLSPSACLKRVQKLKKSEVIEKIIAIISSDVVTRKITILVEVKMDTDNLLITNNLIDSFNLSAHIKQCYQVTGEVDFILIVRVKDMVEYDEFCNSVLQAEKHIKKFTTFVSINCTKFDLSEEIGL